MFLNLILIITQLIFFIHSQLLI